MLQLVLEILFGFSALVAGEMFFLNQVMLWMRACEDEALDVLST